MGDIVLMHLLVSVPDLYDRILGFLYHIEDSFWARAICDSLVEYMSCQVNRVGSHNT